MDVEPGVWKERTSTGNTVFRIMMTVRQDNGRHEVFLHTEEFHKQTVAKKWGERISILPNVNDILERDNELWDNISQPSLADHAEQQREVV